MIFGYYSNAVSCYYDSWYRSMQRMMQRAEHQAFLARRLRSARQRHDRQNQALTSMALTAVNAPKLKVPIRQPVWRAGRWKSLT